LIKMVLASFFDIDGTLVKGLMIHEFPRWLAEKGYIEKEVFEKIDSWVNLYLEKKTTYRKIALEIPVLYSRSLKNLKVEDIAEKAKKFVSFYIKDNILPYTMELVKLMKTYGLTIGISGSPIEVVGYLGKIFNFDITNGTELEIIHGIYTDKVKQNVIIKETKERILEKIVTRNKIDLSKAFGFGDTEQDLSFLSKVGNPIVLNPNQELLSIAQKNGWMIFNSGDDIINEINKRLIEIKSE